MSLVGSLEDLGLGDILQIITLSRKSGALLLRADSDEGRLVFRSGLVCGARVKDRTPDLRQLLVDGGHVSEAEFESARSEASAGGLKLCDALAGHITPERFEGIRRECVERAVLDMFEWETGEFSFEVGEDEAEDEFEVILESGINAQYLAMEGTRRTDEGGRAVEVSPDDPASFADVAEEIESDEGDGPSDAFEAVALTTVERVEAANPLDSTTEEEVEEALEAAIFEGASRGEAAAERAAPEPPSSPAPAARPGNLPPVVVVAPDLPVLEWVKRTLEGTFRRVHIFQKAELAVQRLRQYMSRGDWPLVLVSPELSVDRSEGFRDVDDLVSRMKKQSPRSRVLWLGERDDHGKADGVLPCASSNDAASAAGPEQSLDQALHGGVMSVLGAADSAPQAKPEAASVGKQEPAPSARLASVTARLDDPETRGEVLNVVLQFAAEHFQRVALFMVRDGHAEGLAGLGLDLAGGPGDDELRTVRLTAGDSSWLAAVLETRNVVRAPADGRGDDAFAARLGEGVPGEAWLAPVISRGQVVAILYGDNLPDEAPLGPSEELEAALGQAGQVLGQAMEERTRGRN